MRHYLDFERPLADIHEQIDKLHASADENGPSDKELEKLNLKARKIEGELYKKLTPWQKTQMARHPERPSMLEYLELLSEGFMELHGDRHFADDPAMVGGIGRIGNREVVMLGHQKGRNLKARMARNFGMANPEGYRKALRLMELAERFNRPLVTFIDTPGAYPGVGAEERGQSEAIARNLLVMSRLKIPIVVVIIGEGGSGGALGVGVGDRLVMLEHSVYSVISPEGCAAILWKDPAKAATAADALKMTAPDLQRLGIVDEVLEEPLGGAGQGIQQMASRIQTSIIGHLDDLEALTPEERVEARYQRLTAMGEWLEP